MWDHIIWDDDPEGNVEHIAINGLTTEDVEYVLMTGKRKAFSRTTGNSCVFGYTPDGIYVIVVYEQIDKHSVYPITAYEVPETKHRRK